MARVSKSKAIARLQTLVDEASVLSTRGGHPQQFQKWLQDVDNTFYRIFGEGSRQYSQIPTNNSITPNGLRNHFNSVVVLVHSTLDDVKWEDDEVISTDFIEEKQLSTLDLDGVDKKLDTNKVFVIHGHDEAARETVARFLEKLGVEPVILHEQPNRGRTIIEKFEDYADVGFAVVLLTPDDVGAPREEQTKLNPRARQNVILELGFFIGKLGRARVCPIVKGEVEKPSDYNGVVYTNFDDDGGWRTKLIQELKVAGFDIDANRAFRK